MAKKLDTSEMDLHALEKAYKRSLGRQSSRGNKEWTKTLKQELETRREQETAHQEEQRELERAMLLEKFETPYAPTPSVGVKFKNFISEKFTQPLKNKLSNLPKLSDDTQIRIDNVVDAVKIIGGTALASWVILWSMQQYIGGDLYPINFNTTAQEIQAAGTDIQELAPDLETEIDPEPAPEIENTAENDENLAENGWYATHTVAAEGEPVTFTLHKSVVDGEINKTITSSHGDWERTPDEIMAMRGNQMYAGTVDGIMRNLVDERTM